MLSLACVTRVDLRATLQQDFHPPAARYIGSPPSLLCDAKSCYASLG
jgi:hypothetical protein